MPTARTPKQLATALVAATAAFGVSAACADNANTARWQTVAGIFQAGQLVGSGSGLVTGGGQPWLTTGGHAVVDLRNGHVNFDVRGLVLAGGNSIGTPDGITSVEGTLVCDTNGSANGGNSVLVDTPPVDLDASGDAQFNGELVGPVPAVCATEPDIAFLVRIVPAGRWIAFGAVLR
jgi:hypothetical protein